MDTYVGRFAPSPSGPLHLGSLACALASYLDAKSNKGKWLLRIEDIDPPREQAGASQQIKKSLIAHGLEWDGPIRTQSECYPIYSNKLQRLTSLSLAYRCNCVRKRLNTLHGRYDGHCIQHLPSASEPAALRLNIAECLNQLNISKNLSFDDLFQGGVQQDLAHNGDFVIHRKDGLFAYQLAVVSDDIDQDVNHIIRGYDLLEMTAQQILLYRLFDATPPTFGHIPIIVDSLNRKLSKQNHAPALDDNSASTNLIIACRALGLPPLDSATQSQPKEIISWALNYWPSKALNRLKKIKLDDIT